MLGPSSLPSRKRGGTLSRLLVRRSESTIAFPHGGPWQTCHATLSGWLAVSTWGRGPFGIGRGSPSLFATCEGRRSTKQRRGGTGDEARGKGGSQPHQVEPRVAQDCASLTEPAGLEPGNGMPEGAGWETCVDDEVLDGPHRFRL
jgi:hypothetical protein